MFAACSGERFKMIEKLVKELPEVYQPIFGHPEFLTAASRPCVDRLKEIESVYVSLEKLLRRPLKVLDLGCAQGFFSLSLARLGAVVLGVDYLDQNIALCRALALEHPCLQISFDEGRIEDVVSNVQPGQYDLVLGLSVFHHLVYAHGAPAVKALLEQLAQVSGVLVLEMALKSEPLYWGPSQPHDPRDLINDIGFVHLMAYHDTHLAPIPRPLFVASSHYFIVDNFACKFDYWTLEPHAKAHGVHQLGRRYFFSDDFVLKLYRLDADRWEYNRDDFRREVAFLVDYPEGFIVPKIIAHGQNSTEAWLAMQKLPGRLLLDLIGEGVDFDSRRILCAVLRQLSALEAVGLYHNDVRTWNVLVDVESDSVFLIDYGSISGKCEDCCWPWNIFLAFFVFVKEVASAQVDDPVPLRTIAVSPYALPESYRIWALSLWQRPLSEWSFELMYESLVGLDYPDASAVEQGSGVETVGSLCDAQQAGGTLQDIEIRGGLQPERKHMGNQVVRGPSSNLSGNVDQQPLAAWMKAIEDAFQAQNLYVSEIVQACQAIVQQAEVKAQQAEVKAQQAEVKAQQAEVKAQQAEVKAQQAQETSTQHISQLRDVHNSTSWRITKPLRFMARAVPISRGASAMFREGALMGIKRLIRPVVAGAIRLVFLLPGVRRLLSSVLKQIPWLHHRLLRVAVNTGMVSVERCVAGGSYGSMLPGGAMETKALTPRARQIFADLKCAIDKKGAV